MIRYLDFNIKKSICALFLSEAALVNVQHSKLSHVEAALHHVSGHDSKPETRNTHCSHSHSPTASLSAALKSQAAAFCSPSAQEKSTH